PENGCIPIFLERRTHERLTGEKRWPEAIERREASGADSAVVPGDLIELLKVEEFVVVPLFSPSRSFGVIIADNFVTGRKITDNHINSLELFASQASLAIEHSHLYRDQERRIAELEALTEELDNSKNLLVKAERFSALGQMSAQMVHSIRNPITSIGGMARILTRKSATNEQKRFLDVISKETARLDKVLEDLNNYAGQFEDLRREPVNLCDTLRKTMMLVQPDMTRQNIGSQLECNSGKIEIIGDLNQLRQMFLHLVKNAIEAMPGGGNIEVKVEKDDKWVQIIISDTGEGMPEDSLEKIKDPFFTTKTYGTGLGLTMVENVLKIHDGNFEMKKRDVGGLEVVVNLPVGLLTNSTS
ncbi:MAG: GAF domain-containing sensor histidine kinase, partial [Thermodesulfobacteriota bacterium]